MAELHKRHRRTHQWAFPLGMLLVALAVVGLIALVRMTATGIQQRVENPKAKTAYEEFLANIIVHDPDPFDSVDGVPDKNVPQLLDICLWSILQSKKNTPDQFTTDDEGRMQIPKANVEAEYQKLFGMLPPRHATIEGGDFDFIYDSAKEVYLVPVTAALKIYTPKVTNIKKTGSSVELTVDYLPFNDFRMDERGRPVEPEPAKTMIITLFEKGDSEPENRWQVGSIRQMAGVEVAAGATVIGP
jgi:hypothetical protein